MKRYRSALVGTAFLLVAGIVNVAHAQGPNAEARKHIEIAKAAASRPGHDLTVLYETVCQPALSAKGPVEEAPAKVFDNLYWLGSSAGPSSVTPT